ncbi:hypothetical protein BMF77_01807 [Dolichospermum sp. UHCC 0315A]|nr:hypothetical protein BMF77_01807 [Dolichospermum sp. UHCC 0315A]
MLGISHLLISGTASSLLLQTADPVLTHIPHPKLSQIKKALKVVHNN